MNTQNSISSVTCVIQISLLQLMRKKRKDIVLPQKIEIEPKQYILPSTIPPLPKLVNQWLEICLQEGHIQPSQPKVGKLEGWPIRAYFKNSLFIDFWCWCVSKGVSSFLIPSEMAFYQGTDAIFDVIEKKYQFPALNICRERFSKFIEVNYDDRKTNFS